MNVGRPFQVDLSLAEGEAEADRAIRCAGRGIQYEILKNEGQGRSGLTPDDARERQLAGLPAAKSQYEFDRMKNSRSNLDILGSLE